MILVILAIGWIAKVLRSPGMDRQKLGSDGLDSWAPCIARRSRAPLPSMLGRRSFETAKLTQSRFEELLTLLGEESELHTPRITYNAVSAPERDP